MATNSTRDRLVTAAFELFARQGFESTTVDEIASTAGVGRTTFFRLFPTKEAVIFPDHDAVLAAVEARLLTGDARTVTAALHESARTVLRHYLAEGALARTRYQLTRTVPALRAAEIAGQRRYQRLFREYLLRWAKDNPDSGLRSEVLANAVVTTHNYVLRRWLRTETDAPEAEFETVMHDLVPRLWSSSPSQKRASTQIIVLQSERNLEELVPELRKFLGDG